MKAAANAPAIPPAASLTSWARGPSPVWIPPSVLHGISCQARGHGDDGRNQESLLAPDMP